MSVADLSQESIKEIASYLDEFLPVPKGSYDNDSEQYWYYLAVTLRDEKKLSDEFKFDAHFLTKVGDKKNSAEYFLRILAKKNLNFDVFVSCLKKIKCHKAVNMFTRASTPIIKEQSRVGRFEVPSGGTITMSVEAECHPGPPIYQWFKDQKNLLPGQTTKTLLLHNANNRDTGYYHCRVTNQYINDPYKACVFSDYVHVTVNPPDTVNSNPTIRQEIGSRCSTSVDPPQVTLHPSSVTAGPGGRAKLECRAERAVCYDWFRNGELFKTEQKDGVLVLESLSANDVGEYYCEAVNDHGRKKSRSAKIAMAATVVQPQEAQLRSTEAIVFDEQPPEKLEVNVGEDVVLTCRAHSRTGEQVEYQWFQGDNTRLGSGGPTCRAKTKGILRRWKLSIHCRVSLKTDPHIGAQSRTTTVTVHTVWFTKQPQSIDRAWIGEKAQLSSSADGLGTIEYTWLKSSTKEGNFVPLTKKFDRTGVLYFNRLQQRDWGYYQCQAQNDKEFVTSETVYVRPTIPSVKRANSFKLPLIRIVKQPWSQVVKEGEKFRLLFEAVCSEDVPLSYQWYYCGKKIHGATESAFVREPVLDSDCGPYYCEVKCSNNPSVKPVVSRTARIELAYTEAETSEPVIVGKNIGQVQQIAGEEVCRTKKDERYAREKVALLIGNQNYKCEDLNDLQSPENDIRQLGNLLEKLGFKVISLLDLTHGEMMQALEFFYEMLAIPAVYALFYYSGHGFSSPAGRNFLIPVDATVPLRCDYNIDVETVTKQMRRKHSRAIVVLDCCRVESSVEASIPSGEFDSLPNSEAGSDTMSVANYVLITSTQDGNPAYDGRATELSAASTPSAYSRQLSHQQETQFSCSNFNIAFREALEDKNRLYDVFDHVLQRTKDLERRGAIRPGQRPTFSGSLLDSKITLHDDVFMDNNDNEPTLEKILKLHEEVHYVPDTVLMESRDQLGEMSELVQLELSFSYDFTNVLCVHTRMHLLHGDKTSKARIKYDISFLERQGVAGEQTGCNFESPLEDSDVGGQGETPQLVSTMTRISSIQRLRARVLKLVLTLSLHTEGKEVKAVVNYEFPKKPLFANLHY